MNLGTLSGAELRLTAKLHQLRPGSSFFLQFFGREKIGQIERDLLLRDNTLVGDARHDLPSPSLDDACECCH